MDACHALTYTFHDINMIWQEISSYRGLEHQYYSINCPRTYLHWPRQDPALKLKLLFGRRINPDLTLL